MFAALLCAALAVGAAGCKGAPGGPVQSAAAGEGQGTAMGRWVETQYSLAGLPEKSFVLGVGQTDGTTHFFVSGWENLYDCTAEQGALKIRGSFSGPEGYIVAAAAGSGQTAYVQRTAENGNRLILAQQGAEKQWELPALRGALVQALSFMGEDALFVEYMPEAEVEEGMVGAAYAGHAFLVIDLESGEALGQAAMPEGWYGAMAANAEHVFCLSPSGLLEVYDRKGRIEDSLGTQLNVNGHFAVAATEEDMLYFADASGIYRAAAGGSLVETVLEGGGRAFGGPSSYIVGLTRAGDGAITLAVRDENGGDGSERGFFVQYHFDGTLPARNETELVIWSLEDQPTVRAALLAYGRSHPEVTITYQPALDGQAGDTERADAVEALNTALLAGGGPDVLILDGLPWQQYADQNLLADLGGIDTGRLRQNILAPFETGGRRWAIPARFTMPLLLGSEEALAGLTSPQAVVDKILAMPARPAGMNGGSDGYYGQRPEGQQYAMSFISRAALFEYLYPLYAPVLVQEGSLNETALTELYRQMQAVSEAYGLPAKNEATITAIDSWRVGDELYEFGMGAAIGWCELADVGMLSFNNAYALQPDSAGLSRQFTAGVRAIARPGPAEGLFTPVCLTAVNASTALSGEALAFVETLLSDGVQQSRLGDGLPVDRTVLERQLGDSETASAPLAAGDVAALAERCVTPIQSDPQVKSALARCAAQATPEQAAAAAKKALSLYLAEQG